MSCWKNSTKTTVSTKFRSESRSDRLYFPSYLEIEIHNFHTLYQRRQRISESILKTVKFSNSAVSQDREIEHDNFIPSEYKII